MVEHSEAVSGAAPWDHSDLTRLIRQPSTSAVDTGTQLILAMMYKEAIRAGTAPSLAEVGFSNYSQTEDDGIIWYLLAALGIRTRRVVELGAGDGAECNAANLVLNHQWDALLVDGSRENVDAGLRFLATRSTSRILPPRFIHAWVTRDNVDSLLAEHGFSGEIDVLSIDLDGIDYWVWRSVSEVHPRIVVIEFNPFWLADASVTVPYAPDFTAQWVPLPKTDPRTGKVAVGASAGAYAGASLPAMVKAGAALGYRLVGTNALGSNAFFVRNGLAEDVLPERDAADCFPASGSWRDYLLRGQQALAGMPWVAV